MIIKYLIFLTFLLYLNIVETSARKTRCRRSVTEAFGTKARQGPYCSGQLIFEDNFNNLDLGKWKHEMTLGGGGNWEFQWYSNDPKNSFTKNGKLYIHPTLTSETFGENFLTSGLAEIPPTQCTNSEWFGCSRQGSTTHVINPIRSARLQTSDSFNFKYGKLEVRAKLPAGDWLWPAIWLLPKRNVYGGWPSSGEIDLMESRGNRKLTQGGINIGVEQFGNTLHYGPDPNHNGWDKAHFVKNSLRGQGFNKDFHKYTLIWTTEYIKFLIDGNEIGKIDAGNGFFQKGGFPNNINNPWKSATKMAPFDQEFYIILNLAVGGTNGYFPDSAQNPKPKPWSNQSPQALTDFWNGRSNWLPTWKYYEGNNEERDFQIDYVRVYAL